MAQLSIYSAASNTSYLLEDEKCCPGHGKPPWVYSVVSFLPLGRFLTYIFWTLSSSQTFLFNFAYDNSFKNSFSISNHFLPLGLSPTIRPFITSLSRLSPLCIWLIQFFLLLQITSTRLLSSCTICSTSSFVFMYLQLIFSIFLHIYIPKPPVSRYLLFICPGLWVYKHK